MKNEAFGAKTTVMRCARCGRFADWADSRLQVVCGCRPHLELPPVFVREGTDADRNRTMGLFEHDFGHRQLVAHHDGRALDGAAALIAEADGEIAGALAWRSSEGTLEILALATDPMWQRSGIGSYLLAEVELLARRQLLPRVLVTVTNDNIPALYFYQRRGYRFSSIVRDATAPPSHDPVSMGFGGIPVIDELQLSKHLAQLPT